MSALIVKIAYFNTFSKRKGLCHNPQRHTAPPILQITTQSNSTLYFNNVKQNERQNREDHCSTARKVNQTFNTPKAQLIPTQDSRGPILRSPTTNPRRCSSLRQIRKLVCSHRHPLQCLPIPSQSGTRRQWWWFRNLPYRRVQTSGAEAGFKQQRQTAHITTIV